MTMNHSLPANLPSVRNAQLPQSYEAARTALSTCVNIDECKDWADKSSALASYARQAEDDALEKYAMRIRARAIKRCGELLKAIDRSLGGRPSKETKPGEASPQVSRSQAARDAGLTSDQKKTALRVANVPDHEFEDAIESDDPPTITELAKRGTQSPSKPVIDLEGRDPAHFALSTQAQGHLRRLAEFVAEASPRDIARGAFAHERKTMRGQVKSIARWLERLSDALDKESQ